MLKNLCFFLLFTLAGCQHTSRSPISARLSSGFELVVLGIAQDAGYPQAGCAKSCCKPAFLNPANGRFPTCLGILDHQQKKYFLLDATPDIKFQMHAVESEKLSLGGLLLTHAHIGHYAGLMHLGREVMGAQNIPVYAMPRMSSFLSENGPWSQLIQLENVLIQPMQANEVITLGDGLNVVPIMVPHRDEFSETVGFRITGPDKSVLFIPDIDKWHLWERDITKEIKKVDIAFLDGTFFENGEIPGRDMKEIPHPFITESMDILDTLADNEKAKIHFIHFNHTNPVLRENSPATRQVLARGFRLAREGMRIGL